jgi:histidine triad (HIT) family protein
VSTVGHVASEADCIFCGIVTGVLPSVTIARTERAVALMDINPVTPGHALVIPQAHATDLFDIDADDLAACAHLAKDIAGRVTERLDADGVNLLQCTGTAAWQSVFHFHLHVIPRYRDQPDKDAARLPWDPTPGDLDEITRLGHRLA